jgi:predicted PurR-regulated permease PerM
MDLRQSVASNSSDVRSRAPNPPPDDAPSQLQRLAWLALCLALVSVGGLVLSNYFHALAWALILAIALWPFYTRVRDKTPPPLTKEALPLAFTALIGLLVLLPVATLAVDVVREIRDIIDYSKSVGDSGIPAPEFLVKLPYLGPIGANWWHEHLSHAGWAKELLDQLNTSSAREKGANIGANAIHRLMLFGVCLLTLFFLFRNGDSITDQCLVASQKLFGERAEHIALQMVASVHGTLNGLVFVAIGEGILMGFVYFFTKLPHPLLFAGGTAIAAMIPFAAAVAVALAALILLGSVGLTQALIVVVSGLTVIFVADHFVRPKLIGGATRLPFLWVLLGILGGVETFQLLGLFLGPAIMAALMLLWREWSSRPHGMNGAAADF